MTLAMPSWIPGGRAHARTAATWTVILGLLGTLGCRASEPTPARDATPDPPSQAPTPEAPAAATPGPVRAHDRAGAESERQARGLPDCEWCGADEAPEDLGWDIRIASVDEPGEPMVLEGTVTRADGSPADGVILYVYHTDRTGRYTVNGDETGNGKIHGRLRGWLRTDTRGRYRITTTRPVSYPNGSEAAHVHITVDDGEHPEYWLTSFVFADDPLLTAEERAGDPTRGGSGVVTLERDDAGIWRGTRHIQLPGEPP